MIVAYLRVSTERQSTANQRNEIERFAVSRDLRVDSWVTEIASGSKHGSKRKLGALVKRLRRGDTLIVTDSPA